MIKSGVLTCSHGRVRLELLKSDTPELIMSFKDGSTVSELNTLSLGTRTDFQSKSQLNVNRSGILGIKANKQREQGILAGSGSLGGAPYQSPV